MKIKMLGWERESIPSRGPKSRHRRGKEKKREKKKPALPLNNGTGQDQ